MDNIIPFILETLTYKPVESEKNLMKELRLKFKAENLETNNLRKDFKQALEIGEDLGIFRNSDKNISLPFSLENAKKETSKLKTTRSESEPATSAQANKLAASSDAAMRRSGRQRRGTSRRRQSRSRSRSRGGARSQRRRRSSRR